jgi:hypothetical protein
MLQSPGHWHLALSRHGAPPPWLGLREGWDFCKRCWCYVTDAHLESRRHVNRVRYFSEDPQELPECDDRSAQAGARLAQAAAPLPGEAERSQDWEAVWSEEHRRFYYANRQTSATTWERPPQAPPPPPPPPPEPPQGPHTGGCGALVEF